MENAPKAKKKLLVIGGCGGIGKALVEMALEKGLKVAVFDLKEVVEANGFGKKVVSVSVDASNANSIEKGFKHLRKKWKRIDFLVNLVGFVGAFESVAKLSEQGWDTTINGNLKSTFLGCKMAIPFLKKGGAIVNMSSGLGIIGRPHYAAYSASKAAVISLTKTLAAELAPYIRVNAIAPGAVNTPFLTNGKTFKGSNKQNSTRINLEEYRKMVPLQTIATPEEIAAPIMFLLSDGAKHITGQTLHVNGGGLMV